MRKSAFSLLREGLEIPSWVMAFRSGPWRFPPFQSGILFFWMAFSGQILPWSPVNHGTLYAREEPESTVWSDGSGAPSPLEQTTHATFKGVYEGIAPPPGDDTGAKEAGYLRSTLRYTLDYDSHYYFHFTGRLTQYGSNYLHTSDFDSLWLDNNDFDVRNLERRGNETSDSLAAADFRELWVKYESDAWSLKAGRQRLNWGEGRFFNPLDIVNNSGPLLLEPDEIKGSDSLSFSWFVTGDSSLDIVASFYRSGNHLFSDFDRFRTQKKAVPVFPPFPGEPYLDFQTNYLPVEDPLLSYLLPFRRGQGEYRETGPDSLYQDLAVRWKTPLNEDMDIAFVGGWKARRSFAGIDWAAGYLGAGWRAGIIYFSKFVADRDAGNRFILDDTIYGYENRPFYQAYGGVDYTFSKYFTTGLQYFYNGGSLDRAPVIAAGLDREKNTDHERDLYDMYRGNIVTYRPHFVSLSFSGKITDLSRYELYLFYEATAKGVVAMPMFHYNLLENVDLTLGGRYFSTRGDAISDFSGLGSDIFFLLEWNPF